jgi:hypothetical protein
VAGYTARVASNDPTSTKVAGNEFAGNENVDSKVVGNDIDIMNLQADVGASRNTALFGLPRGKIPGSTG